MRQLATTPEQQEMVAEFERDENVRSGIDLAAPKFLSERQEEWLPRLLSDFETTYAEAAQRLPELRAEITAVEKIDGSEIQIRAMLALRNECVEWMNKLTEARVLVDREFGEVMPEEVLIGIVGISRTSDCRTFALADDEMFRDAIETVKRRDEELTDKRLRRDGVEAETALTQCQRKVCPRALAG
jgi:hypothetical protein